MNETPDAGRVLLFTGDGKGKTTAALGLALRACGHGLRVLALQFVKAAPTGELAAARHLPGFELVQCGRGFVPAPNSPAFEEHCRAAAAGLELAAEAMRSERYGLVILDEICVRSERRFAERRQRAGTFGETPAGPNRGADRPGSDPTPAGPRRHRN